jgi:hypothetical protein
MRCVRADTDYLRAMPGYMISTRPFLNTPTRRKLGGAKIGANNGTHRVLWAYPRRATEQTRGRDVYFDGIATHDKRCHGVDCVFCVVGAGKHCDRRPAHVVTGAWRPGGGCTLSPPYP